MVKYMRLTKTQIAILECFMRDPYSQHTINSLARQLKKRYRVVHANVHGLLDENLVKAKDIGGSKAISLNLNSPILPSCMAYSESLPAYAMIFHTMPQIDGIIKRCNEISTSYCLGIFGSFASGKYKKGSDIDFFVLCPTSEVKKFKSVITQFPAIEDMIDWNVFSFAEFRKGLKEKGLMVYKEVAHNKLIVHGAELFYSFLSDVGNIEI